MILQRDAVTEELFRNTFSELGLFRDKLEAVSRAYHEGVATENERTAVREIATILAALRIREPLVDDNEAVYQKTCGLCLAHTAGDGPDEKVEHLPTCAWLLATRFVYVVRA